MGVFDYLTSRREQKLQVEAEGRERDFVKQTEVFKAAMNQDEELKQMQEERLDLTRWQQDLDDAVAMLKHDLLNEELTQSGWRRVSNIKPMINDTGCYRLTTAVKNFLNRNVMMSNFDEDTIFSILKRLKANLVTNVGANYEVYEIDPTDMSLVVKIIMDAVQATLNRAYNNGERNYLNTINKRIESYNETGQQKKQGLFGGVLN